MSDRLLVVILGNWTDVQDGWKGLHDHFFPECLNKPCCPHQALFFDAKGGSLDKEADLASCALAVVNQDLENMDPFITPMLNSRPGCETTILSHKSEKSSRSIRLLMQRHPEKNMTKKDFHRVLGDEIAKQLNCLFDSLFHAPDEISSALEKVWNARETDYQDSSKDPWRELHYLHHTLLRSDWLQNHVVGLRVPNVDTKKENWEFMKEDLRQIVNEDRYHKAIETINGLVVDLPQLDWRSREAMADELSAVAEQLKKMHESLGSRPGFSEEILAITANEAEKAAAKLDKIHAALSDLMKAPD